MATLVLILISLLLSLISSSYSKSGFTLELIPPNSPKSPFYDDADFVQQMISVPLRRLYKSHLVVEVGIGTFQKGASYKSFFLILDTGSDLIWTQCEGCKEPKHKCYPQMEPPFPNTQSKSYKPLPCQQHPLCSNQCQGPYCSYLVNYEDESRSFGILAKETLTFSSSASHKLQQFKDIVLGCGIDNVEPAARDNKYKIAGVFGMGQDDKSFIHQIKGQTDGRFSYCLIGASVANPPPPMFLRFGSDVKPPTKLQTIDYFQRGHNDPAYYVHLVDLGVNGVPLNIDPKVIAPGRRGMAVDSGSALSYIIADAYKLLEMKIKDHFSSLQEFKQDFSFPNKLLCYQRNLKKRGQEYNNIPSVTFYFQGGAQLKLTPQVTFNRSILLGRTERFCFMFFSDESDNILGAFQQADFKFIYNINTKKLHFGQEDCAKNG